MTYAESFFFHPQIITRKTEILHWEKINECVSTRSWEGCYHTQNKWIMGEHFEERHILWNKNPALFWSGLGQGKSTCDVTRPVGYFHSGLVVPSILERWFNFGCVTAAMSAVLLRMQLLCHSSWAVAVFQNPRHVWHYRWTTHKVTLAIIKSNCTYE